MEEKGGAIVCLVTRAALVPRFVLGYIFSAQASDQGLAASSRIRSSYLRKMLSRALFRSRVWRFTALPEGIMIMRLPRRLVARRVESALHHRRWRWPRVV